MNIPTPPAVIRTPHKSEQQLPITAEAAKAMSKYNLSRTDLAQTKQVITNLQRSILATSSPLLRIEVSKDGQYTISYSQIDPASPDQQRQIDETAKQINFYNEMVDGLTARRDTISNDQQDLIIAMQSVIKQLRNSKNHLVPGLVDSCQAIFDSIQRMEARSDTLNSEREFLEAQIKAESHQSDAIKKGTALPSSWTRFTEVNTELDSLETRINQEIQNLWSMQQNAIVNWSEATRDGYNFGPGDIQSFGNLPGDNALRPDTRRR
jgi:hypothetical protein